MADLRVIDPGDPLWMEMIAQDPAAAVFHHPAWMELLATCYGYRPVIFAVTDRDGQICAGLPAAEVNHHLTPRRFVALPFSDYCAPLYRDEASLDLLVDTLVEQQQARRIPRLEIRAALPARTGIQACSPFVLHKVPLEADAAQVARRVKRQQMQNAHNAEKNGVQVVRGAGIDEVRAFYRLHCLNRRKHGVPVQPWNFFQQLTRLLLERRLGFVLLAYHRDSCVSAGVFLHWQGTLTYKYSAIDEASLHLNPNHLVTWTAMQWGCENGFTTFDFGRADLEDEGLRAYKRRWGAEETPLTYSYLPPASRPKINENSELATLLKNVIRRSPLWVCKITGEVLYRYMG